MSVVGIPSFFAEKRRTTYDSFTSRTIARKALSKKDDCENGIYQKNAYICDLKNKKETKTKR